MIPCGRTIRKSFVSVLVRGTEPELTAICEDGVVFWLSVKDVARDIPSHDQRRRILATDSLEPVEGFRVMVQLTLQHLFGMLVCFNCPNCSESVCPGRDLFGSSARAEGGVFGR